MNSQMGKNCERNIFVVSQTPCFSPAHDATGLLLIKIHTAYDIYSKISKCPHEFLSRKNIHTSLEDDDD